MTTLLRTLPWTVVETIREFCVPRPPSTIRIGSEKNQFVYTSIGDGVFRCRRASSGCGAASPSVLFLFRRGRYWVAVDAPSDADISTVKACGVPVFRSPAEILLGERHPWEVNVSAHSRGPAKITWKNFGEMLTTVVEA